MPRRCAMRLKAQVSKPLKTLDQVCAVLDYFQVHGRLIEFNVRRVHPLHVLFYSLSQDYITGERGKALALTYADDNVAKTILTAGTHTIKIPCAPDAGTMPERLDRPQPPQQHRLAQLEIKVDKLLPELHETIRQRFMRKLRQDHLTQLRVNRRLLEGFEGFHGELARLWEQSRLDRDAELARSKMKDDKANIDQGDEVQRGQQWDPSEDRETARLMARLEVANGVTAGVIGERGIAEGVTAEGVIAEGVTADGGTAVRMTDEGGNAEEVIIEAATGDGVIAERVTADGATALGMTDDGGTAEEMIAEVATGDGVIADGVTDEGVIAEEMIAEAATGDGVITEGMTADGVIAEGVMDKGVNAEGGTADVTGDWVAPDRMTKGTEQVGTALAEEVQSHGTSGEADSVETMENNASGADVPSEKTALGQEPTNPIEQITR